MKLLYKDIIENSFGQVRLIPWNVEDMWHIYNLLQPGDSLQCSTYRKLKVESDTRSITIDRVRMVLIIRVESIDFDAYAGILHAKGRNIEENRYVKKGAYHTLKIEPKREFLLAKECWDTVHLDRINCACDPIKNADVVAVIMQNGLAHVCLVLANMTLVCAKIEMQIPRKRRGHSKQHDKGVEKFFEAVLQAVTRHINFEVVKCVLLASPGFVKDQFHDYLFSQAVKTDNRVIIENKSKFLCVHSTSGFKHSLKEVLLDPAVTARLADTKATAEIRALQNFYRVLQLQPDKACYGIKEVEIANESDAIDVLLITDALVRSKDAAQRKKLMKIIDSVKKTGGVVRMFSSMHVSGEQLGQLTGIAAILRFPVPGLSDCEGSSDEDG